MHRGTPAMHFFFADLPFSVASASCAHLGTGDSGIEHFPTHIHNIHPPMHSIINTKKPPTMANANQWNPRVCKRHSFPFAQQAMVGLGADAFTSRELYDVCCLCLGSHAELLRGSDVCIFCTCKRLQDECRDTQKALVVDGLFSALAMMTQPRRGSRIADSTRRGVKMCNLWSAIFSKVTLSSVTSAKYYRHAGRALINNAYDPVVVQAVLAPRHHHSGRAWFHHLVPSIHQSAEILRLALDNQSNLQCITIDSIAPRLHRQWLAMPCPCDQLPRSCYRSERAHIPLCARGYRTRQPNALPKKAQAPHSVEECEVAWCREDGPSTMHRQNIVTAHAMKFGTQFRSFGFDPSLCIILCARGANPYDDFSKAVKEIGRNLKHLGGDELLAILVRIAAAFTTIWLEWPAAPTETFMADISDSSDFKKSFTEMFKNLKPGSGLMNMYEPVLPLGPKWSTVRHMHCSESYRDFVVLLLLCVQRLSYGVDVFENPLYPGAQQTPARICELDPRWFLDMVTPQIFRSANWENDFACPLVNPVQSCYAVLHEGYTVDSSAKRQRVGSF